MVFAVLFVFGVLGAGFCVLRGSGLAKGAAGLALAPAVGLAAWATVSTLAAASRTPQPIAGALCFALAMGGAAFGFGKRESIRCLGRRVGREHRAAALLLGTAVVVPIVVMAFAFQGVEAPLSTHDGAFHVEVIDALRHGGGLEGWYPPGLEATFAAMLQLLPWVDSAAGSFDVALGLSILAPLAVFGLALAIWRDLSISGLAALLSSLTYLFTYFSQIWSGWPLLMSTLLLLGLWTIAVRYLDRPDWRWCVPGGLLLGAIVLTHGSELISTAIILLVVLAGHWRRFRWRAAALHVGASVGIGLLCAAPYLPSLFNWAADGGAAAVGYAESGGLDAAAQAAAGGEPLRVFFVDALGIDVPVRVVLLGLGMFGIVRKRKGRSVLVVALLFGGLALGFVSLIGVPLVRQIFAVTFPWGLHYRLLMILAVALALVAGAGGIWTSRTMAARWRCIHSQLLKARLVRVARVCLVAWLVLSSWALAVFVSIPASAVSSFSSDDAAAMAWLRQHASAGSVVANDGSADAGIWAPYKAGLPVVLPRSPVEHGSAALRALVEENVDKLSQVSDAAAAACELNVQYVYYGAKNTAWQIRQFPPLVELQRVRGYETAFEQGDAAVLRVRAACPT